MAEHFNDEFVKKAQKEGYRSRAVYKLLEVLQKDRFIQSNSRVLDLGAAPGGWSQVCRKMVGKSGQIIASDILAIEPIAGVDFLRGDFTQDDTYQKLLGLTKHQKIDVVLSDMAPNMSGQLSVDMPKSMYLCELAIDMATKILNPKTGVLFMKAFQGAGFDELMKLCKRTFKSVKTQKPKASRSRSTEVYLLAKGLKNT